MTVIAVDPAVSSGKDEWAIVISERVDAPGAIDPRTGPLDSSAEQVEVPAENARRAGLLRVDPDTRALSHLAATRQDFQQMRKAMAQRELAEPLVANMLAAEKAVDAALTKAIRKHPIWPWLSQYRGLGGVHTARLVALIGNPHRFPGQPCSAGHIFPVAEEPENEWPGGREGEPCEATDRDGTVCSGIILPPRRGTGTRSLWHYLGLHVVDGRSPRKTKGKRVDWNPTGRTAVLQPDGIADAIVRNRTPKYRDIYDTTKERLIRERVAYASESAPVAGPLPTNQPETEGRTVSEMSIGLRPYQIDAIARKVAAKAFVADLLQAWKAL